MKLFIIIVTYNSGKHIGRCLESLRKAGVSAKIVVVDNGSTDGTVGKLKTKKLKLKTTTKNLKLIQNEFNLGFARACNTGIKYALKEGVTHVMLLNPDTVVSENFLEPLLENGSDIVGPVGGRMNFILGRPKHTDGAGSVDFITGACMLVKREVFEKIGLFDERFFLYFEDVDFCLRAKKAGLPAVRLSSPSKSGTQGFSVSVEPKSHVVHHMLVGAQKPLVVSLYLLKSNFIFINRWVPLVARPFAHFYWFALSSKILTEYLLKWILYKS